MIQVSKGTASLIKKDIFKNLMWYILPDSNKQYPLTIERVRKIKSLNQQGVIPDELEAVDLSSSKPKEVEHEFVDVVGHISLRSLEKADKKRKQKGQQQHSQGKRGDQNQQRPQQKQHPNQSQKGQQHSQQPKRNDQNQQRPPRQSGR